MQEPCGYTMEGGKMAKRKTYVNKHGETMHYTAVMLPDPVVKALKAHAKAQRTTTSAVIRDALAQSVPAVASPKVVKRRPVRQLIK